MPAQAPGLAFTAPRPRHATSEAADHRNPWAIEVVCDLVQAAPAWRELEQISSCTPYGQFAWVEAWCSTVGVERRQEPLIAVIHDQHGRPAALLPLVRHRVAGVRVASFAGGKDANGMLPLFAEPAAWDSTTLCAVLARVGAQAGIDLFALCNHPATWQGKPQPLALLQSQASPSGMTATGLDARTGSQLSKQARKRLRQKTGWLEALGPVDLLAASTPAEINLVLAAYTGHRAARADATGVAPPTAGQIALYRRAAKSGTADRAVMELYALRCGSEIVATFGGTGFRDRFSGMILSVDSRADYARCSPGELLLRRLLPEFAGRGFTRFDLGVGEARYKTSICDAYEPLFDSFIPVTKIGRPAALVLSNAARLKRQVKQSAPALAHAKRLVAIARQAGLKRVSRP